MRRYSTLRCERATLAQSPRTGFLGTNMAMISKPFQVEELAAKISEMLS
jgi:hypothetical protein